MEAFKCENFAFPRYVLQLRGAILPALAQPAEDLSALKCADFRHNSDGSGRQFGK